MESLRAMDNDENLESEVTPDDDDEVGAWRNVHSTLLLAVHEAQKAIAVQKAQRRFWLEEIVHNLDDTGRPANRSVWQRPVQARMETKKKKRKKNGPVKSLATTTTSAKTTKAKKKKPAKSGSEMNEQADVPDYNGNSSTMAPPKKRRRTKNETDNDPKVGKKRTKVVIKRTASNIKPAKSNVSIVASTYENEDLSEFADRSEPHRVSSSHLRHANFDDDDDDDIDGDDNHNSSRKTYHNHPNWTIDDNDVGDGQHHPYSQNNDWNIINNNNADDDDGDNGDDDDDLDDHMPSSPTSAPLLVSHHSVINTATTTTPTIRNYTSLQDIAMNEDDSDEGDRF